MTSTVYRRQSMAQLYEKLRAQDNDDDTAWLAQFSPDDKFDEPYVAPVRPPPALSAISSASPVSSSSRSSMSHLDFDNESSDDSFDFDSDSDVDLEPLELPYSEFDPSSSLSLILQSHHSTTVTDSSHSPRILSVQVSPLLQSATSTPLPEEGVDILPAAQLLLPDLLVPSIASRRTTRSAQKSLRYHEPAVLLQDANEDVCSESDGNGSEDEYVPSPTLSPRKRYRPARSTSANSSQKRNTFNKQPRPRCSPLPRNLQAEPGVLPGAPATKNNPWACPYCKWVQRNHRTPDLKRHIRTHTRLQRPAQWVCCGVPIEDAENYNVPVTAKPYVWAGETMIGGCRKEFSRRDALKRHLDNDHINCIGDFSAFASVCEDEN